MVVELELRVGGVACFQLESESGIGVVFSKLLELESGFQKCWSRSRESESVLKKWGVGVWSRSRFFELKQFIGWSRSRNPKKSSDSTTLVLSTGKTPFSVLTSFTIRSLFRVKDRIPLALV